MSINHSRSHLHEKKRQYLLLSQLKQDDLISTVYIMPQLLLSELRPFCLCLQQ